MPDDYLHGHVEAVLRSHRWRTAENSSAHLLGRLHPTDRLLDVGCGPGTITIDLARRLPEGGVVGIDRSEDVLSEARTTALADGVGNVEFRAADLMGLPFDDGTFDVVHAHQVLQHLTDPVGALREMARVTRPGGLVAVRESDYGGMTWAPGPAGLDRWCRRYREVARDLGADPDAGRHLLGWFRAAGLDDVEPGASVWCFTGEEDRAWWSGLWIDRVRTAPLVDRYRAVGVDEDELDDMVRGWSTWAADPAGWFVVLHGEAIATIPSPPAWE
jgi:SAM-dependent methyltransferase